ncbi:MAG: hypothetical protein FJX20_05165 [Alphaproteobacteria bacterium]|nr:hypothetical protein [Alphaproteobacteria bacterium]
MTWRPMTDEELVSRPEARLEGSLLLIMVCAAALGVIAILLLLAALLTMPASLLFGGFASSLLTGRGPAGLAALYAIPTLYLLIWALVFSIMTLMRSSSAPGFACWGLIGWTALRLVVGVAGQFWIASQYSGGAEFMLQSLVPMLLTFIGELMLVAGFWIYMRDGARPNGYYRRLVRA